MMKLSKSEVVVIVGASVRSGRATAQAFAKEGAHIEANLALVRRNPASCLHRLEIRD
jgi:NAD(P)-dependent dehydrogenase (short-subunit alcohol dehydrogenase family)